MFVPEVLVKVEKQWKLTRLQAEMFIADLKAVSIRQGAGVSQPVRMAAAGRRRSVSDHSCWFASFPNLNSSQNPFRLNR